ncbi:hypothetical protein HPP92_020842 [Vanilla planifolia]|uniref:Uncharacterized protein n=1 Tax=Vanilla planifolia TaxID=51239 RepID=A0A835PXQ7_VANPL|nr:hypothetical protein HPP92_020842 [Vanilla planifolia]
MEFGRRLYISLSLSLPIGSSSLKIEANKKNNPPTTFDSSPPFQLASSKTRPLFPFNDLALLFRTVTWSSYAMPLRTKAITSGVLLDAAMQSLRRSLGKESNSTIVKKVSHYEFRSHLSISQYKKLVLDSSKEFLKGIGLGPSFIWVGEMMGVLKGLWASSQFLNSLNYEDGDATA